MLTVIQPYPNPDKDPMKGLEKLGERQQNNVVSKIPRTPEEEKERQRVVDAVTRVIQKDCPHLTSDQCRQQAEEHYDFI